jgi:hypothetical protein
MSEQGDPVAAELLKLRSQLASLKGLGRPNEPLAEFDQILALTDWDERLSLATRETLIEEATSLLATIKLPALSAVDARTDHLRIYHYLSELHEQTRIVISKAMDNDYPHSLRETGNTGTFNPSQETLPVARRERDWKLISCLIRSSP